MSKTYTGSCLCGTANFELKGEFKKFFLCHCSRCQKTSGSAHCANLFAPGAQLNWLSGAENLKFYQHPETNFSLTFCRNCGSNLPTDLPARGLVKVPAGSLNTPVEISPQAHIFTDSRGNWDQGFVDVPSFEKMPS